MTDEPNTTELIEKLTEQANTLKEMEIKLKAYEDKKTELEKAINDKDSEITKLQKIIATNFIATKKEPEKSEVSSFEDDYRKAIMENINKK